MEKSKQLELVKKTMVEFLTDAFEDIINKVKSGSDISFTKEIIERDIVIKVMVDNELVTFKIEYPKFKTMTVAEAKAKAIELKATGMSQVAISKKLKLSQKTISNYINNKY